MSSAKIQFGLFPASQWQTRRLDFSTTATGALVALGAFGCLTALLATSKWGIGILADSTVYVGAARSLLSVGKLQDLDNLARPIPLIHFPPVLPTILAGLSWIFRTDPLVSARYMNALLFGINIAVLGSVSWRVLKSAALGIAASLLALVFTPMVMFHLVVLSEPLYLFFSTIALLFLHLYVDDHHSKWLVLAGLMGGLSLLTRHAGMALIIGSLLTLLLVHRNKPLFAILEAAKYGLLSCLPMALWVLRNRFASGSSTSGYHLASHPKLYQTIFFGIDTLSIWFFPAAVPSLIRITVLTALLLSLILVAFYQGGHATEVKHSASSGLGSVPFPITFFMFIVSNVAMLLFVNSFIEQDDALDDRLLLPIFGSTVILLLWSWQKAPRIRAARNPIWIAPVLTIGLLFVTNAARSTVDVLASAHRGIGYSSIAWRNSALINQVQALPQEVPIYTTLPSSVRFLTGRPARLLPIKRDRGTGRVNPDYDQQMSELYTQSVHGGLALIYLPTETQSLFTSEPQITKQLNLQLMTKENKGAFYVSSALVGQLSTVSRTDLHSVQ